MQALFNEPIIRKELIVFGFASAPELQYVLKICCQHFDHGSRSFSGGGVTFVERFGKEVNARVVFVF